MKFFSKLILLCSFIIFISSCNGTNINSQWTSSEIEVNGDFSEWANNDLHYLKEAEIMFGALNDSDNIYLMFRSTDPKLVRKIQRMGVTLWLDKEGKKKKESGICYTGSIDLNVSLKPETDFNNNRQHSFGNREDRREYQRRDDLPGPGKIFIINKEEKMMLSESNFEGPCAGSADNNGIFCYEFKMPIPVNCELGSELSLCMELGGINKEQLHEKKKGMGSRGGGMRGGGMKGGNRGGGRGGGMGRQGGSGMRNTNMLEPTQLWMKFVLAENIK